MIGRSRAAAIALAFTVCMLAACSHGDQCSGPSAPNCGGGNNGEIGPAGGIVASPSGDTITVPRGALLANTRIALSAISQQDVEQTIGQSLDSAGFHFLRALDLQTGGVTFQTAVELSVPNSLSLPAGAQVIVEQVVPDVTGDSTPDLILVEIGTVQGTRIVTASPPYPGVRRPGTLVLLQPAQPLGFFTGIVNDSLGNPVDSAIVTTFESQQLIAQTSLGAFVLAVADSPAAGNKVSASRARDVGPGFRVAARDFARANWGSTSPSFASLGTAKAPGPVSPPIQLVHPMPIDLVQNDIAVICPTPNDIAKRLIKRRLEDLKSMFQTDAPLQFQPPSDVTLNIPSAPQTILTVDFGGALAEEGHKLDPTSYYSRVTALAHSIQVKSVTLARWVPQVSAASLDPTASAIVLPDPDGEEPGILDVQVTGLTPGPARISADISRVSMTLDIMYEVDHATPSACADGAVRLDLDLTFDNSGLMVLPKTVSVVPDVPPVAEIAVVPASAKLYVAGGVPTSIGLTATPKDVQGNVLTGRTIVWSSSDEHVATVASTGPSSCQVTAVGPGMATIAATSEGVRGTSTINVDTIPLQIGWYNGDATTTANATPCGAAQMFSNTGMFYVDGTLTIAQIQDTHCQALLANCTNIAHGIPCTGTCTLTVVNSKTFTITGRWTAPCGGTTQFITHDSTWQMS